MKTVTSADGTRIAFDRFGAGKPIIMSVGAFNDRATTEPLARALAEQFTVVNYDRRGRGDSGDSARYSVEREIEDIDALIAATGEGAGLFGYSSGAVLALKAAASGLAIGKLALYEPPFRTEETHPPPAGDLPQRLAELVSTGRRGDAVELFQAEAVRIPEEVVVQLRHAPFRPSLEALAHTLVYDATIIGDLSMPTELIASVETPTLVICGEESSPFMRAAARAVANALPNGQLRILPGQAHSISPAATGPVLSEFLAA